MQTVMTSDDVMTKELLDHLGLKNCSELLFHFKTNSVVVVTAKLELDIVSGNKFVEIIKRYNLVEEEPPCQT